MLPKESYKVRLFQFISNVMTCINPQFYHNQSARLLLTFFSIFFFIVIPTSSGTAERYGFHHLFKNYSNAKKNEKRK